MRPGPMIIPDVNETHLISFDQQLAAEANVSFPLLFCLDYYVGMLHRSRNEAGKDCYQVDEKL